MNFYLEEKTLASREKVAVVVGMLAEAYGRKTTSALFEAYHATLADVTDELLSIGGTAAMASTRDFMPTPGQLRELSATGGIGYEARAERAWLEFDRVVSHHGPDRSVSFADGLINATVRTIGDWGFCCGRKGTDYSVWLRKMFLETYKRLCVSGASESMRAPLMGNIWRENWIFPDEILEKLSANTGQIVEIGTSQPVLLPPGEPQKQVAQERPAGIPRIEFKKA